MDLDLRAPLLSPCCSGSAAAAAASAACQETFRRDLESGSTSAVVTAPAPAEALARPPVVLSDAAEAEEILQLQHQYQQQQQQQQQLLSHLKSKETSSKALPVCLSLVAWAAVLVLAGTALSKAFTDHNISVYFSSSSPMPIAVMQEDSITPSSGPLGLNEMGNLTLNLKNSAANGSQLPLPTTTTTLELLLPPTTNLGVTSAAVSFLGFVFSLAIGTTCFVGCVAGLQYTVVKAVEAGIERFDRDYLGTDIEIGEMHFNIFTGRLEVDALEMKNPEGFSDKGVVKAAHFVFDIDMMKTIASRFHEVEITELVVEGITANLEFDGYFSGKSNVQTVLDFLNNADLRVEGHIQPVYCFWHAGNHEHTFHCAPAWPGEVVGDQVFFAPLHEVPHSKPVYDFWSFTQREHIFRMGEQHSMLEKKGSEPVFYAFETMVPGTEPVYQFWHPGNKEHTIHFEPAWPMEEKGDLLFFAYREHPDGASKARRKAATKFEPVCDFWHSGMQQHTFHMKPAWGGEKLGKVQFYAHTKHEDGLVPVNDYWHEASRRKRFHTGDARKGEEKRSPLFWVHETQVTGTEPVFEFFHEKHNEYNIHMGPPWQGEVKQRIAFYAHREVPSMFRDLRINLRRVELIDITATSSTRLAGMKINLGSLGFLNFSEQFQVFDAQSIVSVMVKQLFGKVSLGFA